LLEQKTIAESVRQKGTRNHLKLHQVFDFKEIIEIKIKEQRRKY
jgi:hypothetical protein